jgi:hypothetical protein
MQAVAGARRRTVLGPWLAIAALPLLLPLSATGCAGSDPGPGAPAPTTSIGPTARDLAGADLWLSFEERVADYDGAPAFPDAAGGPTVGRVVTANGGRAEQPPGADGTAASLAFPAKCTAPTGCPRAMVEVRSSPALDPGPDDFEFGATVWLAPDQTTTGSNIVQKGRFGSDGGQWKLQVDSEAGEPSCVVRSGADVLLVRSTVSIADSTWHHVVCRRDESGVTIQVDGTVDRRRGETGTVANRWPIRVGSPGAGERDDQFHGRVDDVFLDIDD